MAKGNKGFADLIQNTGSSVSQDLRHPLQTGILSLQGNRLAELATGTTVTGCRVMDPARHCIWRGLAATMRR